MFNWTKRPSDALRKRREGDAAQRLANTLPDRLLPERPSLDGYTVREVSRDEVAQLLEIEARNGLKRLLARERDRVPEHRGPRNGASEEDEETKGHAET